MSVSATPPLRPSPPSAPPPTFLHISDTPSAQTKTENSPRNRQTQRQQGMTNADQYLFDDCATLRRMREVLTSASPMAAAEALRQLRGRRAPTTRALRDSGLGCVLQRMATSNECAERRDAARALLMQWAMRMLMFELNRPPEAAVDQSALTLGLKAKMALPEIVKTTTLCTKSNKRKRGVAPMQMQTMQMQTRRVNVNHGLASQGHQSTSTLSSSSSSETA